MNKPENPFQQSVLEMHPMNQVPYHIGHSMGLLNVDPQHDLYCSATQAMSYRLFHRGWSDGRVLAESRPASIELNSQLVQDPTILIPADLHGSYAIGFDCDLRVTVKELRALVDNRDAYEAEAYALQDQVDEANASVTALEQRLAEAEKLLKEVHRGVRHEGWIVCFTIPGRIEAWLATK